MTDIRERNGFWWHNKDTGFSDITNTDIEELTQDYPMTVEEVIDLIENNADNEVDEEEEDNIDAVKQKTLTEDVINEAMNKIESAMK